MYIDVENASVIFNTSEGIFHALDDISLSVEKGEFICIIGSSGCGKSTLLNSMAGFIKLTNGSISIDGHRVEKPNIKYVTIFQNYGLLPWRNVESQVCLGLETLKYKKDKQLEIADKYIELVGLKSFKNSKPWQLSGGQQQRVAIARALAVDPDVIFMDEPFGALDAITRMKLQDDVRRLAKEEKKTIIFVTHDIEEAVYLSDRIIVMEPNPGHIKGVVTNTIGEYRDRTSDGFISARDKVFDIFNLKSERNIEYYI